MTNTTLQKGLDYTGIVAVFWIHDGNGKFFFSQRSEKCRNNHHQWECGGGGIKFGEDPEETISRELKEELGCNKFVIDEILPYLSHVHESERGKEHWIALPHVVRVNADNVTVQDTDMIEDSGWFALNNPPQPLDHGTSQELELYKEALSAYSS